MILLSGGTRKRRDADIAGAKGHWRDYSNALIEFDELSRVFDKSSKSFMPMVVPKGNPQASNLFAVNHYLQDQQDKVFGDN